MDTIRYFSEMALEGYVLDSGTVELNLDQYKPGQHNVLFVTGLSGSGKTTLALKVAKEHNAKVFSIDCLTMNGPQAEYDAGMKDMLAKKYPKYREVLEDAKTRQKDTFSYKFSNTELLQYIGEVIKEMHRHPNQLYVVEGVQIYDLPMDLQNEPLIVTGTSALKSFWRRLHREFTDSNGKMQWTAALRNEFINCARWYLEEEGILRDYRKSTKI